MIFDDAEVPDTKESVEATRQEAQRLVQLWNRRAIIATIAFFLSCGAVYPFLEGRALHSHWNSVGKYLLLLTMALLVPLVICGGIAINTRAYRRNLGKIEI